MLYLRHLIRDLIVKKKRKKKELTCFCFCTWYSNSLRLSLQLLNSSSISFSLDFLFFSWSCLLCLNSELFNFITILQTDIEVKIYFLQTFWELQRLVGNDVKFVINLNLIKCINLLEMRHHGKLLVSVVKREIDLGFPKDWQILWKDSHMYMHIRIHVHTQLHDLLYTRWYCSHQWKVGRMSYWKFWIYWVGLNTKFWICTHSVNSNFTIWGRGGGLKQEHFCDWLEDILVGSFTGHQLVIDALVNLGCAVRFTNQSGFYKI